MIDDEDLRPITPAGVSPFSLALELAALDDRGGHYPETRLERSAREHAIPSEARERATERLIEKLVRGELTNP